jgi:hypothetical protein
MNNKYRLIDLPKITDYRGDLTFIENNSHIPFAIKRVFYLYNIPENVDRAGHAHKTLEELLICLHGSFTVYVDDGKNQEKFVLNTPNIGLYISSLTWVKIKNFSVNSISLVLASTFYDESDYIRDYSNFITLINQQNED